MRDLTLQDILKAIRDNLAIIVLITVVVTAVVAFVNAKVMPPVYSAKTTFYVLNRSSESAPNTGDINASTLLVKDYEAMASSRRVRDGAARQLNLQNLTGYKVSVSLVNNTRLVEVRVEGENAVMSANVANALVAELSACIEEVMKVENITIVDTAVTPASPTGPQTLKNTAVAGIATLLLVLALVILKEAINTRIRTSEDVERFLKLPVLTKLPKMSEK